MKKSFLILSILCILSNSFAGQLIVSASGYYSGVPYETGTYDSVNTGNYYTSYVSINLYSSSVYNSDSFSLTDIICNVGTAYQQQDSYYYGANGHWDPIPAYKAITAGPVNPYSTVGVNLEVYGVDTYAVVNY